MLEPTSFLPSCASFGEWWQQSFPGFPVDSLWPSLTSQSGRASSPTSASCSASWRAPGGEACCLGEYIQVSGVLLSLSLPTCAMFSNQLYQYLRFCFSSFWSAWPLCLDLIFFQTWVGNRNATYWPCKPWEWSPKLAGVRAGRGSEVEFYSEYNWVDFQFQPASFFSCPYNKKNLENWKSMTVLGLIRELRLQGKLPLQNQERWGIQMVTARPTGPIVKEKKWLDTC